MPQKKKMKKFSAVTAVKSAARATVGTPPPTRKAPSEKDKLRQKAEKHKPTLEKLLSTEE